jgi:predicted esterase
MNTTKTTFVFSLLACIILLSSSCGSFRNKILRGSADYEMPVKFARMQANERGDLIKYELVNTLKADHIKEHFPTKKGVDHAKYVKYDVRLYRIFYSSENRGEKIVLSGMVGVPQMPEKVPFAHYQYHHGTLLPVDLPIVPVGLDAPSLCDGKYGKGKPEQFEMRTLGLVPASNGYFVSLPDYAGYSVSRDKEHPYGISTELGNQSVDMIKASKVFAKEKGIALSGDLYLAGYSEGGYAAVATHKMIEEQHPDWNLKNTAALAGPYNFVRFMEYIIEKKRSFLLPLYNWALYSALEYSNVDIPNEDVWKYKVEDQFDALAVPFIRTRWIFKKKFRKDFTHNPNNAFRKFANENLNLHDGWTPKAPIHFYTGTEDEVVPSFNTMDAYEGLKKRGGDVYYHPFEGEGHLSSPQIFLVEMLDVFAK